jgi:hypothetical protein
MATYYPVSIPAHGVALNVTVQSYNGSLDFGLTACRRAVPDVREIADHLVGALAELTARVDREMPAEAAAAAITVPAAVERAAKPASKPRAARRAAGGAAPAASRHAH